MRIIDADSLIPMMKYATTDSEIGVFPIKIGFDAIKKVIDEEPTVEERKFGYWILHENQRQEDVDNGNYLYTCSECGKSDLHAKVQEVPYCWWCGAKMEGWT